MTTKPDRVIFETLVCWSFNADVPCDSPSVSRYQNDFSPGERLSLSRSVAEARASAGLGRVIGEDQ